MAGIENQQMAPPGHRSKDLLDRAREFRLGWVVRMMDGIWKLDSERKRFPDLSCLWRTRQRAANLDRNFRMPVQIPFL